MQYTKRDWVALVVGWACAFTFYLLIPEFPLKLLAVFATGFISAYIIRGCIHV